MKKKPSNKHAFKTRFISTVHILFLLYSVPAYTQTAECLDFSGTNDYVTIGNLGAISDWTIEMWFKPVAALNYQNIFQSDFRNGNNGVRLETSADYGNGHLYVSVSGNNSYIPHTIVPLSTTLSNTWQHLAIVGDKAHNKIIVYLDGVDVRNEAHTNWPTTFPNFGLGAGFSTAAERNYSGRLDEFRIWNDVRTPAEIVANKNTNVSPSEPGLVAYYKFNQGISNGNNLTQTTLLDATGNHNGTLTGFTLNSGVVSNFTSPGPLSILSVNLTEFIGTPQYNGNFLTWTTANEVNNKGFQVERLNSLDNWDILCFKTANTKLSTYEFMDNTPLSTSYYRLRQIDIDGKETLSKVITINTKGHTKLKLYPSVTSGFLTVETAEITDIQIFNLLGQKVLNSTTTQRVDVSALPQGTYIVKVGTEQTKFIKQ